MPVVVNSLERDMMEWDTNRNINKEALIVPSTAESMKVINLIT